jgi:hypothetical protein
VGVEHRGLLCRWTVDELGITWQRRRSGAQHAPWSLVELSVSTGEPLRLRVRPRGGPALRVQQLSHPAAFMAVLREGLRPHLSDRFAAAALDLLCLYARIREVGESESCADCDGVLARSLEPVLHVSDGVVELEMRSATRRRCTSCGRGVPLDGDQVGDVGTEVLDALDRRSLLDGVTVAVRHGRTKPAVWIRVLRAGAIPPSGGLGDLQLNALVYGSILEALEHG